MRYPNARPLPPALLAVIVLAILPAHGQSQEELAKKLANPVASLISAPFQFNYDQNIGPEEEGKRFTLNIQPVIPISLNDDWTLISRTILPVVSQDEIFPGAGSQFGTGDIVQSAFFSPKEPGPRGVIWGAGPVLLLPTATDELLGTEQWGLGPTVVVLKQDGPWTYGALANHIWSVAGDSDRSDVSATFVQPFLAHTTKTAWTYTANLESSRDWEADEWSIPLNLVVSKVSKIGGQLMSMGGGLRYWLDSPEDVGPEGLGVRAVLTLLFPK